MRPVHIPSLFIEENYIRAVGRPRRSAKTERDMNSTKAAFAVLSVLAIVGILTTRTHGKSVHVENDLPSGIVLRLHCRSKDDDLGVKYLLPKEESMFSFNVNVLRTTLFYCDVAWVGSVEHRFTVFNVHDYDSLCESCHWIVRVNGTCLLRSSISIYRCYDWK